MGSQTSEVALKLLAQLVSLAHPAGDLSDLTDAQVDQTMVEAQAMLAELEPTTATTGHRSCLQSSNQST